MARVHNMNILEQLLREAGMPVTLELGASKKFVKTVMLGDAVLLANGQQYNMSSKNHELFEIIEANYLTMQDKSMASSKVEHAHVRGDWKTQGKTYVKDENVLVEALDSIRDDLDAIIDCEKDLQKMITKYGLQGLIANLMDEYTNTISSFDLSDETKEIILSNVNNKELFHRVKDGKDGVITKHALRKIQTIYKRGLQLIGG